MSSYNGGGAKWGWRDMLTSEASYLGRLYNDLDEIDERVLQINAFKILKRRHDKLYKEYTILDNALDIERKTDLRETMRTRICAIKSELDEISDFFKETKITTIIVAYIIKHKHLILSKDNT